LTVYFMAILFMRAAANQLDFLVVFSRPSTVVVVEADRIWQPL